MHTQAEIKTHCVLVCIAAWRAPHRCPYSAYVDRRSTLQPRRRRTARGCRQAVGVRDSTRPRRIGEMLRRLSRMTHQARDNGEFHRYRAGPNPPAPMRPAPAAAPLEDAPLELGRV